MPAPVPRKAVVSRIGNATFGLWFPVFRRLARHVPPVWFGRLSAATVERAVWARESVRDAILDNYSQLLGLPPSHPRVEEMALAMLAHHSRLWIDLLHYSGRKDFDPVELLAGRTGEQGLLEAQSAGTGAILLTAHVGNFELGGLFLRGLGLDCHAVYAPDPSSVVEKEREKARQELGVKGIPVGSSPFAFVPVLEALKANSVVAMQGDRDVSGTGVRLPFFGKTASFPIGPFRLAQASGAPLFPVFILQEADGRYRTVVERPIRVERLRDRAGDDARAKEAMTAFVAILSDTIRRYPAQWYLFRRFWEDEG